MHEWFALTISFYLGLYEMQECEYIDCIEFNVGF
jgi:hypothetical protein